MVGMRDRATIFSAALMAMCVATCATWVLSYWRLCGIYHLSKSDSTNEWTLHSLELGGGAFDYLYASRNASPGSNPRAGWEIEFRGGPRSIDVLYVMRAYNSEIAGFGFMSWDTTGYSLLEFSIPCWAIASAFAIASIAAFRGRQKRLQPVVRSGGVGRRLG